MKKIVVSKQPLHTISTWIYFGEPKGCTKRSCKDLVPLPKPFEKDYITCESCRAQNAASKKWKLPRQWHFKWGNDELEPA